MTESIQVLPADQLDQLLQALQQQEFSLFGPVKRDGAVLYDQIRSSSDLPKGVEDEQSPGRYRLKENTQGRYFAYTTSPDSWKKFLFPKEEVLYSATQEEGQLLFKTINPTLQRKAFIGVRACDLHGIAIQDRVFLDGNYVDGHYAARRSDLFIVAINCSRSVDTCFCASLDAGPAAKSGFDIALTEVVDGSSHYFTVVSGSEAGAQLMATLNLLEADAMALKAADAEVRHAAQQSRRIETQGLKESIYQQLQSEAFWEELGERCLHCANCTLVCPTCFCSNIEDQTDLVGEQHTRVRHWDSCFNQAHSHIAGGSIHETPASRYRQWLSHKLASWQDQFDTLGCTGCGRCISWCPVGIDITEEAQRLQALAMESGKTNEVPS